ncbi:MAG: cation:proton antiporter [Bdellovibrionales bacterium GWB1_55_8]|nr:MAG: cation:proton antiporter [Bdellovibrionales bacterium GWB1_55_8]
MRLFLWNLLLAFFWGAVSDELTLLNLLFGFAIGFLSLWIARRTLDEINYFQKIVHIISFFIFFAKELVLSTLKIAHDVMTPRHRMLPGVLAIPLQANTDLEITLLANIISLTPGTLSLDISSDRKILYIHAMYITNRDKEMFRKYIKDQLERRVLELLR